MAVNLIAFAGIAVFTQLSVTTHPRHASRARAI